LRRPSTGNGDACPDQAGKGDALASAALKSGSLQARQQRDVGIDFHGPLMEFGVGSDYGGIQAFRGVQVQAILEGMSNPQAIYLQ
jgi:hypothetical protein